MLTKVIWTKKTMTDSYIKKENTIYLEINIVDLLVSRTKQF